VRGTHPQKALVMVDFLGLGHDYRLERKQDTLFAQRRPDLFADRQAAALALALLAGHAIMAVTVAPGALGVAERALGPGDHVVGREALVGERRAADRHRRIDRPALGHHRRRAHRTQDLLCGRADILFRAMLQHGAEAVAAEPADRVADP